VILHWLGEVFDPALAGYWGSTDVATATRTVRALIESHRALVAGIKVSLLDAEMEIGLRRVLPTGVRMYTGDDFHYSELIQGDEQGFSDALLGVLAVIAPPAAAALRALDAADSEGYVRALTAYNQQLLDACPNRTLFGYAESTWRSSLRYWALLVRHSGQYSQQSLRRNGKVHAAVRKRDADKAAEAATNLLQWSRTELLSVLTKLPTGK